MVGKYRLFPYTIIADGYKTGRQLLVGTAETTDHKTATVYSWSSPTSPWTDLSRSRIEFVAGDGLQDPVLWYGGRFQFLELCPDTGCLAVEYTATGEVAHAWPFRPYELEAAAVADEEYPYELAIDHSFVRDVYPFGIVAIRERRPAGDIPEWGPPPTLLAEEWPESTATAIRSGTEETTATIGRSYWTTAQPWCPAPGSATSP